MGMADDVHELSAGYALDALGPDERQRFEEHLPGCDRCRAEVDAVRGAAAALAIVAPSPSPPPELRVRILDAARVERPNVVPLRPGRSWWAPAAVAATVAAVAAGTWAVVLSNRVSDRDRTLAVLADPSAKRVPLGNSNVTLVVSPSRKAALTGDLRDAPPGKAYEAWVITDRPRRAGMLGSGGRATLTLDHPLPRGATVAITLEREGGVDAPTSKPLAAVRA
jgi:anti-sigma-K factor RskA